MLITSPKTMVEHYLINSLCSIDVDMLPIGEIIKLVLEPSDRLFKQAQPIEACIHSDIAAIRVSLHMEYVTPSEILNTICVATDTEWRINDCGQIYID